MYNTDNMASCMQRSPTLNIGPMGHMVEASMVSPPRSLPLSCSVAAMACKEYNSSQAAATFTNNNYHACVQDMEFDESFDEEVDEEFSDEDPECEMDGVSAENGRYDNASSSGGDATTQLLKFADMVNGDIQKYFGAKKGDEESCNIYEDKWKHSRSGRELYYADLMKIAQGIDTDIDEKVTSTTSESTTPPPTGKMDKKVGLGPLGELFEYGLKDYWNDRKMASKLKKVKKFKSEDSSKFSEQVPLNKRQLPDSFWSEPRDQTGTDAATKEAQSSSKGSNSSTILTSSKTPDFSDLLESWTGDDHEDMSSSDLATPSPTTATVQPVQPAH